MQPVDQDRGFFAFIWYWFHYYTGMKNSGVLWRDLLRDSLISLKGKPQLPAKLQDVPFIAEFHSFLKVLKWRNPKLDKHDYKFTKFNLKYFRLAEIV